jgi:alkylation response protein AidB-like acyl-CoA dehydrogenase
MPMLQEAARFSDHRAGPAQQKWATKLVACYDQASGRSHHAAGLQARPTRTFVEGGWTGLTAAPELGGQGLPHTLGVPLKEMIDAANLAWGNFPLLSHGATEALVHHGEAWQQRSVPQAASSTAAGPARCASPNRIAAPTSAC